MRGIVAAWLVLVGVVPSARAEDGEAPPPAAPAARLDAAEPAAFLAAARARHRDLTDGALSSFAADFEVRRTSDDRVRLVRDQAGFGYSFEAPAAEEFDFSETLPILHKPWRDAFAGLWRDLSGAMWFDRLAAAADLQLADEEGLRVVRGTDPEFGAIAATFDPSTGRFVEMAIEAAKLRFAWFHDATPDGFAVRGRDAWLDGAHVLRTEYSCFREANGRPLPTIFGIAVNDARHDFAIRWRQVDGRPAVLAPPDRAWVKAEIEKFEKQWKDAPEEVRAELLWNLAVVDDDQASTTVAKRGLSDKSEIVRAVAADVLGAMKRPVAVPALLAALKASEESIALYVRLIDALGRIGDPKAVPALSKDWWNQKTPENSLLAAKAKIAALGNIRHASSVDELIATFSVADEEKVAWIRGDLNAALVRLTGQDFGADPAKWKDWWKKHRSSHKFSD